MNKTLALILAIVAIIIAIAVTLEYTSVRTVDWEENYNEKSNTPYGLSVLYKELPNLFEGQTIKTVYYSPYTYFYANSEEGYGDHIAEGSYIAIGKSLNLVESDFTELLLFVERGNTIFLSDYNFPQELMDTFNLAIDSVQNPNSVSNLYFEESNLELQPTEIDKNAYSMYFSMYKSKNQENLGYVNNDLSLSNFLKIPLGDGMIFLHLEPKVFTNYNILKDQRYRYAQHLLSFLPASTVYFDSYTKYRDSYGAAKKKSDLSWFLSQKAFRWAWYITVILTFAFIVFNAKRRQRIIPIIRPLENTTVDFVKTISNLYYETQDHENLILKKIKYFLEKIRSDHNLDTTQLNDEMIAKLSQKSDKNLAVVKKTINFISWLKTKNEFTEENLLKLNTYIEEYYS